MEGERLIRGFCRLLTIVLFGVCSIPGASQLEGVISLEDAIGEDRATEHGGPIYSLSLYNGKVAIALLSPSCREPLVVS